MKFIVSLNFLFLWCTFLSTAQQQSIQLEDEPNVQLRYFQVKPEIVSLKTSLLFVPGSETPTRDFSSLASFFTEKGMAVFKLDVSKSTSPALAIEKAFLYLQENSSELNINPNNIGLVTYKGESILSALPDVPAKYIISVQQELKAIKGKKLSFSDQIPVLLLTSSKQQTNKNLLASFNKLSERGNAAGLLFTGDEHADSAETNLKLVYDWIAGFGGLEPLLNEKTEAQKKADDWIKFQEYLEHLLHTDWPLRQRFADDNKKLKQQAADPGRVVFMGNSITEGWINTDREFFDKNPYVNRGIGGQTTSQMLVRFRNDVVELKPKAVVILAGTNDIAENTGPISLEDVFGNLVSMAELAKSNGIKVYICSVLPAFDYPWKPGLEPAPKIMKLNKMLQEYTQSNNCIYVDYFSAMVDDRMGMKAEYSADGVHPNLKGYKVMEPILQKALQEK
ncbi:MAG: GDSL-type esterase/lipase family protein [Draconibacterium sp.]